MREEATEEAEKEGAGSQRAKTKTPHKDVWNKNRHNTLMWMIVAVVDKAFLGNWQDFAKNRSEMGQKVKVWGRLLATLLLTPIPTIGFDCFRLSLGKTYTLW